MPRGAVGLDIGTHSIHVAHVSTARGTPTVVNFGGLELPSGAVREGEVVDVATVADGVRELIGSAAIKEKRVMLGVANQRVVVRQVDLPWLPEHELRSSLRFQVQEHIPIPVEDAELDFEIVDDYVTPGNGDGGSRMARLLLVAAAKDMVAGLIDAAVAAGLKPVGVDLNSFAVLRAMGRTGDVDMTGEVLVDIGAGVTNIVVHQHGVPTFVRILVMGGNDITEALVTGVGLEPHDAEQRKRRAVIGTNGHTPDDVAERIVSDHAAQFVDEVRSSLDYYQTQTAGHMRLSNVVITGGGALLEGLPERLARALRLPVEVGNPFDRLPVKGTVYGPEQLAMVGPTLTTSVGLALGGTS